MMPTCNSHVLPNAIPRAHKSGIRSNNVLPSSIPATIAKVSGLMPQPLKTGDYAPAIHNTDAANSGTNCPITNKRFFILRLLQNLPHRW